MDKQAKDKPLNDRSTWAIGGGTLLGLGIGLVILPYSALGFVGALIAGLGLGLIISAILSTRC
ncbi:hypothetical protein [Agarivorans gilvus]|uniref:Uncharacterized protein n=1 Tax=Agarivorans gilvus TaxID=680279 RepID=A0ABQ1I4F7_9ALTE|nr:hypothetical protein [Agarivorans gilvus]GGB15716.1 hypothetical protein GCM10007414_31470 [Agarivorans gilvus]